MMLVYDGDQHRYAINCRSMDFRILAEAMEKDRLMKSNILPC